MSPFSPSPDAQQELLGEPGRLLAEVLDESLPADAVRTVYQPIVDLEASQVVGFEALMRGPAGTPLESPLALFDVMREADRIADFDRACRDAALARAKLEGVDPPLTVFVNVEPDLVEEPWDVAVPHVDRGPARPALLHRDNRA